MKVQAGSGQRLKTWLIGVALATMLLVTLACNFSVSTANISDAYTARNDGAERTTIFKPNEVFYAIVDLANAPDDTTTKATWYAVNAQGLEANYKLDETALTQGSGQLTFSLTGNQAWPAGTYKVEIYLNDKLERTLEFQVEAAPTPVPTEAPTQAPVVSTARISDAFLALDESGAQPSETFGPADIFHLLVKVADANESVTLKSVWTVVQAEGVAAGTLVKELEGTLPGSGNFHFELSNNGPWPVGVYKVDLFLNGVFSRSLQLTVVAGSAAQGHPMIGGLYLSRDEDGNQPTQVFGVNDKFYAILDLVNAPATTVVRADWYLTSAPGYTPNTLLDDTEITTGSTQLTFDLSNSSPWPVGSYRVEIYIDGALAQVLEFSVQ